CWSTSANPSVAGLHTSDGTGNGTFVSNIPGLTPNTDYYVRAYATNSAGTAYGNERTFKTDPVLIPTISTNVVTSVTLTTATSGGNVTSDNGGQVTERGVCWNTTGNPTTANPKTSDATGTGVFSSNLTGLATGTAYYVRAFATNSAGTAYGNQVRFSSSLSDIDGNIYRTVIIGNQLWMQSDLKTTKYTDNTDIPNVTDNTEWANAVSPAYCWYNNLESYGNTYGIIYNWYTVETGKLCPSGWSVPTDGDYKTLELYLGMTTVEVNGSGWRGTDQGTQLKSTSLWFPASGNGTNSSGFTALAGGYRYGADGSFNDIGALAYWWSSSLHWFDTTKGVYRRLDSVQTGVYREGVRKSGGKFVRCLKN
ncbi:MAG: fibrobacter succinogenes major paralogous domain-containing protein, partial [Bacteroidales bacterium]